MRLDLHVHTVASSDSTLTVPALFEGAAATGASTRLEVHIVPSVATELRHGEEVPYGWSVRVSRWLSDWSATGPYGAVSPVEAGPPSRGSIIASLEEFEGHSTSGSRTRDVFREERFPFRCDLQVTGWCPRWFEAAEVEVCPPFQDALPRGAEENPPTPIEAQHDMTSEYGYSEEGLKHYTCMRAAGPIIVDGRLDEESWQLAPRSPRFVDMETLDERPAWLDTRAAALWDDEFLYVAFWLEEPDVRATLTERDSYIFRDNDVEVFIAGQDGYYELELNALGTIMERFYIWQDAYLSGGYDRIPEFDLLGTELVDTLGGDWSFFRHPRGRRWAFREWDMPGLRWAVHVDGTINDSSDIDRGWTAEIAFPWQGLKHLAGERSLPPRDGDLWRLDFSRFQHVRMDEGGACPGWVWSSHGYRDSHIPDRFTYVHISDRMVDSP